MRIILTYTVLLVILLTETSCVTKYLWGDSSYEEKISKFYTGDGRYVVLIGENYHYIFTDNSGKLRNVLSLHQKGVMSINLKKSHLKLNKNNEVRGDVVVEGVVFDLSSEDKKKLVDTGMVGEYASFMSATIPLYGRRYAARYLRSNSEAAETSYIIKVSYNDSNMIKNAGKVAVTPIAVSLDAVLLIGKVVIVPFELEVASSPK